MKMKLDKVIETMIFYCDETPNKEQLANMRCLAASFDLHRLGIVVGGVMEIYIIKKGECE